MKNILNMILSLFKRECQGAENVERDIVIMNGLEVVADDPETRK